METSDTRERLARMETILERLDHQLLGNGQKGEIEKLKDRIVPLEDTAAKARGAFYTLSTIITFIGGGGLWHVFGRK